MPTLRQNYDHLHYTVHVMSVALNCFNQTEATINQVRDAYERIDAQMTFDLASPGPIRESINDSLSLIGAIAETNGKVDSAAATIYRGWIAQVKELLKTPESTILVVWGNSTKPTDKQIRRMITQRGNAWNAPGAELIDELGGYEELVKAYEARSRYERATQMPYTSDEGKDDGRGEEKAKS